MVYFVTRSQYESPLGHTVYTFDDHTLLDWYQRVWVTDELCRKLLDEAGFPYEKIEPSEVYEILSECGDYCEKTLPSSYNSAWFLSNMYNHPVPRSYEDLRPFVDSFEGRFCEGEIHFVKGAVEVKSDDDEIDFTWHLFDSQFACDNPDRVEFLLHPTKELPIAVETDVNFTTKIPTLAVGNYETDGNATYACLLSALDGGTIDEIDGCFKFPVRLPDFPDWLKSNPVDPLGLEYNAKYPWNGCILLLRALSIIYIKPTLEKVLQEFSQYDQKLYGWSPRVLSDYNWGNKPAKILIGNSTKETEVELEYLLKVSERIESPGKHHSEYRKFPAWIQSSDHMVQAIFECGVDRGNSNCQRWIFFDDLWASANRNLAESILRYGNAEGAARILTFTGFYDYPLLKNFLESKKWTLSASNAFLLSKKTYRCEITTLGIEVSVDGEQGVLIFNEEDPVIAHLRSIIE